MQFFSDNSYQGILGLGAPENAEPNTGSFIDVAKQRGAVPVMAFELCPTTGTMWIGGFDAAKAAGAPGYTPLIPITADARLLDRHQLDVDRHHQGRHDGRRLPGVGRGLADRRHRHVAVLRADRRRSEILAAINASPGFKTLFGATAVLPNVESQSGGCITKAGVTAAMVDAMLPTLTMTMPNKAGGADISVTVKPMVSYMYDGGQNQWCFGIDDDQGSGATLGDQINAGLRDDHRSAAAAGRLGARHRLCSATARAPADPALDVPPAPAASSPAPPSLICWRGVGVCVAARYADPRALPAVYLVSWEEQRVDDDPRRPRAAARQAARSSGRSRAGCAGPAGRARRDLEAVKPVEALDAIGKLTEPSLVVLKDFHPYLDDPLVVRALRELGARPRRARYTTVDPPVADAQDPRRAREGRHRPRRAAARLRRSARAAQARSSAVVREAQARTIELDARGRRARSSARRSG